MYMHIHVHVYTLVLLKLNFNLAIFEREDLAIYTLLIILHFVQKSLMLIYRFASSLYIC